jgi:hypothetical protein
MSKVIDKIKSDPRVESVSDERIFGDGFWVYLKTGFACDPETHCIHEDSPSECWSRFKEIHSCECDQRCKKEEA